MARCAGTASAIGALPGGNRAASSISRRNSTGTEPIACSLDAYVERTALSDYRTVPTANRQPGGRQMPYYRSVGTVPRKRHTQFRTPEGGLYAEELIGLEGFSQESSLLYHRHLPTAIVSAETVPDPRQLEPLVANDPLLPRHFRTDELSAGGDA